MIRTEHDIIVVGGGHAGCEAALAAARMGTRTLLLTLTRSSIGRMSCNPAVGGLAKGQLAREVDALGGDIAKVTDETGIQFRMLNLKKGPAVHSPRAQVDRLLYEQTMQAHIARCLNLDIAEDCAATVLTDDRGVTGVAGTNGQSYLARRVILTTGTFLRGLIHIGPDQQPGGRIDEPPANELSRSLESLGLHLRRLKTGTPPRLDRATIDHSHLEPQFGDPVPCPFSFSTERLDRPNVPCYITHTNAETHRIVRDNLDRAPLYTGQITSVGPRYCPSLETKIVRFPDKDSHLVFLEPEGIDSNVVYANGISTSVPRDVQDTLVASIPGLERARILRYGYAIEYDFVPPTQTGPTLESKLVPGLFLAGQINGTSGYEEAAAQGIVAGINAVKSLRGQPALLLTRAEAYIGVLIDDLVTRGTEEPYRMFTSRAEYRLVLRQDNADRRLMKHGHDCGLISDEQYDRLRRKEDLIAQTRKYMEKNSPRMNTDEHASDITASRAQDVGADAPLSPPGRGQGEGFAVHSVHDVHSVRQCPSDIRVHPSSSVVNSLLHLLKRTENDFATLEALDPALAAMALPADVKEQVEIEAKYEGYIRRQTDEIDRFRRLEDKRIPSGIDYAAITGLTFEAREKLAAVRPLSLGQASRISGVSPADISVLLINLAGRPTWK